MIDVSSKKSVVVVMMSMPCYGVYDAACTLRGERKGERRMRTNKNMKKEKRTTQNKQTNKQTNKKQRSKQTNTYENRTNRSIWLSFGSAESEEPFLDPFFFFPPFFFLGILALCFFLLPHTNSLEPNKNKNKNKNRHSKKHNKGKSEIFPVVLGNGEKW